MPFSETLPRKRPSASLAQPVQSSVAHGLGSVWSNPSKPVDSLQASSSVRFLDRPQEVPRRRRTGRRRPRPHDCAEVIQEDELTALAALCELKGAPGLEKQCLETAPTPMELDARHGQIKAAADASGLLCATRGAPDNGPAAKLAALLARQAADAGGPADFARAHVLALQHPPYHLPLNVAAINNIANALARNAAAAGTVGGTLWPQLGTAAGMVAGSLSHNLQQQQKQQQQQQQSQDTSSVGSERTTLGPLAHQLAPRDASHTPSGSPMARLSALDSSSRPSCQRKKLKPSPQLALPRTAFTACPAAAAAAADGEVAATNCLPARAVLPRLAMPVAEEQQIREDGLASRMADHISPGFAGWVPFQKAHGTAAPKCPAGLYHVVIAHSISQHQQEVQRISSSVRAGPQGSKGQQPAAAQLHPDSPPPAAALAAKWGVGAEARRSEGPAEAAAAAGPGPSQGVKQNAQPSRHSCSHRSAAAAAHDLALHAAAALWPQHLQQQQQQQQLRHHQLLSLAGTAAQSPWHLLQPAGGHPLQSLLDCSAAGRQLLPLAAASMPLAPLGAQQGLSTALSADLLAPGLAAALEVGPAAAGLTPNPLMMAALLAAQGVAPGASICTTPVPAVLNPLAAAAAAAAAAAVSEQLSGVGSLAEEVRPQLGGQCNEALFRGLVCADVSLATLLALPAAAISAAPLSRAGLLGGALALDVQLQLAQALGTALPL